MSGRGHIKPSQPRDEVGPDRTVLPGPTQAVTATRQNGRAGRLVLSGFDAAVGREDATQIGMYDVAGASQVRREFGATRAETGIGSHAVHQLTWWQSSHTVTEPICSSEWCPLDAQRVFGHVHPRRSAVGTGCGSATTHAPSRHTR